MFRRGYLTAAMTAAAAGLLAGGLLASQPAMANNSHVDDFSGVELKEAEKIYRHESLASANLDPVSIALVIGFDSSISMDDDEFYIQTSGAAQAINSERFRQALKYKPGNNDMAIAFLDFDDRAFIRVPWVDIRGDEINDKPYRPGDPANSSAEPDKLDMLALEILNLTRLRNGGTQYAPAFGRARKLFSGNPWEVTERRIFDMFSDGISFVPFHISKGKLAPMGVTINGFAILNKKSGDDMESYLSNGVVSKDYESGEDGIWAEPGRVWVVADDGLQDLQGNQRGMLAFIEKIIKAFETHIMNPTASLEPDEEPQTQFAEAGPAVLRPTEIRLG